MMHFFAAKNVSENRFPASDTSRSFRAIPRFCALHTGKLPRGLSCAISKRFYSRKCGLSRVISKRSYSSNSIDPKKKKTRDTWGKYTSPLFAGYSAQFLPIRQKHAKWHTKFRSRAFLIIWPNREPTSLPCVIW